MSAQEKDVERQAKVCKLQPPKCIFTERHLWREDAACFRCEAVFCCSGPGSGSRKWALLAFSIALRKMGAAMQARALPCKSRRAHTSHCVYVHVCRRRRRRGGDISSSPRRADMLRVSCAGPIVGYNNYSKRASKHGRGGRGAPGSVVFCRFARPPIAYWVPAVPCKPVWSQSSVCVAPSSV